MEVSRKGGVKKRWENLETDILMRIFQNNFTMQELLTSGLAHVCRGWRVVCCDPVLWSTLDLSNMKSSFIKIPQEPYVYVERRSDEDLTRFLKLSMSLSKGNTTALLFHFNLFLNDDMITYTAKRCPNLKRLVLPAWNRITETGICNAISVCRKLESLTMPSIQNPHFVFELIARYCKKYRELKVMGPVELFFVQNLVQLLPRLKVLSIRCTAIHRDALIKILEKMKKLEVLNISHSYLVVEQYHPQQKVIVRELDQTIMEKASKLKRFVTCMKHDTCVMCQRTERDEGIVRWYKYEEGLWKADEVSSLHL